MSNQKILIKNSTKEEREKIVNGAIALSMLDAPVPSKETMDIFQRYIDDELEIDEI